MRRSPAAKEAPGTIQTYRRGGAAASKTQRHLDALSKSYAGLKVGVAPDRGNFLAGDASAEGSAAFQQAAESGSLVIREDPESWNAIEIIGAPKPKR